MPMMPRAVVRRMPPWPPVPILAVDSGAILPTIVLVPMVGIGVIVNDVGAIILKPILTDVGRRVVGCVVLNDRCAIARRWS